MANFCSKCGSALGAGSAFCANCGTPVASVAAPEAPSAPVAHAAPMQTPPQSAYNPGYAPAGAQYAGAPKPRTRSTAILLAIFLGYWSWLYTFKVNKGKFFAGLGFGLLSAIVTTSVSIYNSNQMRLFRECIWDAYMGTVWDEAICYDYDSIWWPIVVVGILGVGMYVWSLVDNIRKSEEFYRAYPNVK